MHTQRFVQLEAHADVQRTDAIFLNGAVDAWRFKAARICNARFAFCEFAAVGEQTSPVFLLWPVNK